MQKHILLSLLITGFMHIAGYCQNNCDAELINNAALYFLSEGSFKEAHEKIDEGLSCDGDSANVPLLLTKYQVLRNRRKYKSAKKVAFQIESVLDFRSENKYSLISAINLAEIHALRGQEEEFRKYYHQAESLLNTAPANNYLKARMDFITGFSFLQFDGKEERCFALYKKTIKSLANDDQHDVYLQGQMLRTLGNRNRRNGDFPQSLRYYQQELELYEKHYAPKTPDMTICHYNLGGVLYEMYEYKKALHHFLKCYDSWDLIFKPKSRYYRMLTEAIGDMYWELENRPKALAFYNLAAADEIPVSRDSSQSLSEIADTLLKKGQEAKALQYYQQALDFRERNFGKGHPLTAACQNYVGRAHQLSGETEEALLAYQQSLMMLTPGFRDSSFFANPEQGAPNHSVQLLLEALAGKGELLLHRAERTKQLPDLQIASETLRSAVGYLEQFRQSPKSEAAKLFWNSRSLPLLENALRSQVLLFEATNDKSFLESAFILAEKSKAFLLLSAIQEDQIMTFAGIPKILTELEQNLRNQILDYENKILGEERKCAAAREKQLELWREKLKEIYQEYDLMLHELQENYPRYFDLKYKMDIQKIGVVQKKLNDQHIAILEFFEGDEKVYIFYIDATQLNYYTVEKDSNYLFLTQKMPELLNDRNWFLRQPEAAFRLYKKTAFELFEKLLKQPLSSCPDHIKRVLIIPGQSLFAIPFSCLLTEFPDTGQTRDYTKLPYLLNQYSVAYAPSTTIWVQTMSLKKTKPVKAVYTGFAPDSAKIGNSG